MSLDEIRQAFEADFPKAIDFPMTEYDDRAVDISGIAQAAGYRFFGYRLGRAVFSTKSENKGNSA